MELLWGSRCAGCDARGEGRLCGSCRPVGVHRAPVRAPWISGTWVLGGYDAGLGAALRRAKVAGDRAVMVELADLFAREMTPALRGASFAAVVPVPAHWRSRARRGFSSAALLARAVSVGLGVPVVEALSVGAGPRQATLVRRSRARNLRGRVRSRRPAAGVVLLVDDVVTTGATAAACARELLGDASSAVWLAALCATRRHPSDDGNEL